MLYMRSKLDLCLDASKLTGLVKRNRMGSVQDVISGLQETKRSARSAAAHPGGAGHP